MNKRINNLTVVNDVNNCSNNKMNNVIDFSSVCCEETIAQTATIDQQVINDLFNAFIAIPSEVVVKFKNDRGFLKMVVNMTHREKFFHCFETYADAKLIENILGAMRGDKISSLECYKTGEHPLEASEADPRIEIFRQFVGSPLRCNFDTDFVANNGDRYISATFNICYRKRIKFCLKRTEEIETIINEAIQAA